MIYCCFFATSVWNLFHIWIIFGYSDFDEFKWVHSNLFSLLCHSCAVLVVIRKLSGIIILLVCLVVIVPLTTSAIFVFLGLKIFGILPFADGLILPGCREDKMRANLRRFRRRLPLMTLPVIRARGLRKPLRIELTALCKMFVLINTIQAGLTTSCQISGLRITRRGSFQLTLV